MAHVEKSIVIQAPPEKVFARIEDNESYPEWWPNMIEQKRDKPGPLEIGSRSKYKYNMLGATLVGEVILEVYEPPQRVAVRTTGGANGTFDWRFRPEGSGTRLDVVVDYTLPGSFLGKLADKLVVEKRNEADLEEGLKKLKALLES
jgi:uncharacterized protein YndB with AHSA1/START domain